jgi:hypothetical protein
MCALSALNLSYNAKKPLEEAHQHYQSALSVSATPTTPDDLLSDGVFLRHLLLFIYDICIPMDIDHGGDVMWAQHLNHLKSIAVQRHQRLGREPHGYLLWLICELDLKACLLGSGRCEFVTTMLQHNMLPPLEQQIPTDTSTSPYTSSDPGMAFVASEAHVLPTIIRLNEGVVLNMVKLAQLAQQCRAEAAVNRPSPGANARWQASVAQMQNELIGFWAHAYPQFLGSESPQAGANLPLRAQAVFEHAFLLHQTSIIYSRTSMFPHQRMIPFANQVEVNADTERRCMSILSLASTYISQPVLQGHGMPRQFEQRHIVFPVFMAGIATSRADAKMQAIDIITALEKPSNGGIGQNTFVTKKLLIAVCEEQSLAVSDGGRVEEVDWLTVSRDRGLSVVNCGL